MPTTLRRARLPAAVVACALALLPAAAAQATWIQVLDGSAPGTPARVQATSDSSAAETRIEVEIPGFWMEEVTGYDGKLFQRIHVPGLRPIGQTGAPELPAARAMVALATDADEVFPDGVDEEIVQTYRAITLMPQPILGTDGEADPTEPPGEGDPDGTAEVHVLDTAIYTTPGLWPFEPAIAFPPDPIYGAFKASTLQIRPFTYDPVAQVLRAVGRGTWVFAHPGQPLQPVPVTKQLGQVAETTFINWYAVQDLGWTIDALEYRGRYAILVDPFWAPALEEFVAHKKLMGFEVSVLLAPPGRTLAELLQTVAGWYAQGEPGEEHYLLLVGDADRIPMADYAAPFSSDVVTTDDVYGSPVGNDFAKEIFVGRLSVELTTDLQDQLRKLFDYERNPVPGGRYDRALLVAHKEGGPVGFAGNQEKVRTASYATPPEWVTLYGTDPSVSDADVSAELAAGAGLVAYRGHGTTKAWWDWTQAGENFHTYDVYLLANSVHPVVWSIACWTGNIGTDDGMWVDCFTEYWLEVPGNAGVAAYGASAETHSWLNDELNLRLFEAVYDKGLVVHGHAIAYAEQQLESTWPHASAQRAFNLVGDPSMRIRRDVPHAITSNVMRTLAPCEVEGCSRSVPFQVTGEAGEPLAGALVTLHKPSFDPGEPDEVHVTRYTDANGLASLPVAPWTPGPMAWSVQDGLGDVSTGQIQVTMGAAWEDLGGGMPGSNGPLNLVGVGTLEGGTPVTTIVKNLLPDSVATLVLGLSPIHATFKGGLWVPKPDILIPGIPTGPDGVINLPTTWPMGFPAGFSFYEQYWMADPGAPLGFAGSNALRGTTP